MSKTSKLKTITPWGVIILLPAQDFDKLDIPDVKDKYGVTDSNTHVSYVRYTGIPMIDNDSIKHELEHLRGNHQGEPVSRFYFKGGGGAPAAPQIPEYNPAKDYKAYIKYAPQVASTQIGIAPQFAQSDFNLYKQYAPQYLDMEEQLKRKYNPQLADISENLAGLVNKRYDEGLTPEMTDKYRSMLRAEVGPNVGSGIGGDYVSKGLIDLGEQYKQYYQNLGLSLSGRYPLNLPSERQAKYTPEGLTPNQALASGAQGYSAYVGAQASIYGAQAQYAASRRSGGSSGIGSLLGMMGGGGGGGFSLPFFCWIAKEIFGSWDDSRVHAARFFILNYCPMWFIKFYAKHGEKIASYIHDKPFYKMLLKPLFLTFAILGKNLSKNTQVIYGI